MACCPPCARSRYTRSFRSVDHGYHARHSSPSTVRVRKSQRRWAEGIFRGVKVNQLSLVSHDDDRRLVRSFVRLLDRSRGRARGPDRRAARGQAVPRPGRPLPDAIWPNSALAPARRRRLLCRDPKGTKVRRASLVVVTVWIHDSHPARAASTRARVGTNDVALASSSRRPHFVRDGPSF